MAFQDLNLIKDSISAIDGKISVAESLTAGILQNKLGEISGISCCFEGGVTAYSLDSKVKMLNINREHAKSVNCVSERVAIEMARGAQNLFNTNIALSTTGYAEAYPCENVDTPYAYIALAFNNEVYTNKITLENSKHINTRDIMRLLVANESFVLLSNILSKYKTQLLIN